VGDIKKEKERERGRKKERERGMKKERERGRKKEQLINSKGKRTELSERVASLLFFARFS
jgi:hypothetical protein